MNEQILVVNENDEVIGLNTKENCHAGQGILHRAITIFVFNDQNEILLTKRSALKKLWPNFWDTSCSTHLRPGETNEQAGEKRLNEEIGFSCPLKPLLKFQYRINFKNIGSEYELCHLLIGHYAGEVKPNQDEVSDYKWISVEQLKNKINHQDITPWLKIAFEKYLEYLNDTPFNKGG
ncbi:MAG: Isopentenyl-diphosphate Delta-isomerase [Parcubacteria group bacterium GW2011_GWC2_42_12]|uniref:Isopentenyl-diphosphate delta-isomerase n=1 Tax=Candidatus Falkowbacteria bacterium RIFCSPHIGHO2_02_FULL_42_9 TaxID=1797986 RepID=A0A1F5S8P9_9BACT|nr:MAG: Isopentenyl-diphosphate Delta-isomerase [Parcubacteria group bacterium GW2011_GWC2_42_12]OGF23029.1 MAG: isopentenyl-diphosphate delta-isomerase [Candidatus Falkowbacteria bacterium RIFCSPHIGHO2_02_FULL_42_9]